MTHKSTNSITEFAHKVDLPRQTIMANVIALLSMVELIK